MSVQKVEYCWCATQISIWYAEQENMFKKIITLNVDIVAEENGNGDKRHLASDNDDLPEKPLLFVAIESVRIIWRTNIESAA